MVQVPVKQDNSQGVSFETGEYVELDADTVVRLLVGDREAVIRLRAALSVVD